MLATVSATASSPTGPRPGPLPPTVRLARPHPASIPIEPAGMRAVAPIDLPGVRPVSLAGASAPIMEHMRPCDLLIDARYQRELSPKSLRLVRSIVENFDWLRYKAPVVAMTDRGFEVVDGQHTVIACACHPDLVTIPVLVVDGSDLARRAKAFVSHAVDRIQARPVEVWSAAVTAGDEDATTVRNVLDRAGVSLVAHSPETRPWAPNETMALGAVRRLVDRRGAMRSREVMEIVAAAGLAPIQAEHVRAAEALLLDLEYAGGLDAERITAALRDLTPKQAVEAKEIAFAKRMPLWRAMTAVLFRAHKAPARRGRGKAGSVTDDVTDGSTAAEVEPIEVAAITAPTPARVAGIDDIPMAALMAGIEVWRRGGSWNSTWGPAPDDGACGVPAAMLGAISMIVGCFRTEAVIHRTLTLWRLHRAWPEKGWGPSPDDADCPVPFRFRVAAGVE